MKNCDSYAIRRNLIKEIDSKWWRVLYIEDHFYKVSVKKKYKSREKMKNKLKNNYLKNKRIRNGKLIILN